MKRAIAHLVLVAALCLFAVSALTAQVTSRKLTDKEVAITVMRMEPANIPLNVDGIGYKEIFNKTGVKVNMEPVPIASYVDKKKVLIATNNLPDVIHVNFQDLRDFASSGVFLPISDYASLTPNFNKLIERYPDLKKFMMNGKFYGFPVMGEDVFRMGAVPVIRTDLLKKHNLKTPDTFDELYTVLKKLKEIYPQSYPWTARYHNLGIFLQNTAYPMGSGLISMSAGAVLPYFDPKVNGGSYVFGPSTPEFKRMLEFYARAYKEGILDPDYATNTPQQWTEKLTTGKAFFAYDNPSIAINWNKAIKVIDPNAKFEPIPIMKNFDGERRNNFYQKHWWDSQIFAISAKTKNPEVIVKLFDWMYGPEGYEVTNWGAKGQTYNIVDGEPRVAPDVLAKVKATSDAKAAYQLNYGLSYAAFTVLIDERYQKEILDPDMMKWYQGFKTDKGMTEFTVDPPFTKVENERIKNLAPKVENIYKADLDKFIMGLKPMSEFDDWATAMDDAGAAAIEKIYNEANKRLKTVK